MNGYQKYFPRSYFYKLIVFSNVRTVNHYTKKMAKLAEDIDKLKWFVKTNENLESVSPMLMHAIGFLQKASVKGYEFVKKNFDYIWY